MKTLKWIRTAAGKSLRSVWLLTFIRCAMAAIAVGYALLMQASIDAAVAHSKQAFWLYCGLFAVALLLQAFLSAAARYLQEESRAKVENALRSKTAGAILSAGRIPQGRHTGDAMTILTSDVTAVCDGVTGILPEALSLVVRAAAALVLLWSLAPALVLLFVVAGTLCAGASLLLRKLLKRLHAQSQQAEANMRSYLQEALESLVVVRSFGSERKVGTALGQLLDEHLGARLKLAGGKTASAAAFNVAMQLSYLAGFAWGCYGILMGTVSYGTLMAVVQLVGQIRAPFAGFSGLFAQYTAMAASAERLMALGANNAKALEQVDPAGFEALAFEGVDFTYAEASEPVLTDFSVTVSRGEFLAIVGPSGAGKSTALMLALGISKPDSGRVSVAFENGRTVDANRLASGTFAYVPQGNMLMSGTIRNVITFGCNGMVDDTQVKQAAEAAQALNFIKALPYGFDTQLGEHGSGLSEGQMQRLAVARAICCGAPVLLLDEATSALDEQTERRMLGALRQLERTVIIVTHRPAALEVCDRVVRVG